MVYTAPGRTFNKQVSGLEQPSNCSSQRCWWGSPASSPCRAGLFMPQYLLMGCYWHCEEFSQQGMASLLHPALVTDISSKYLITFHACVDGNLVLRVVQDVFNNTLPSLASFLKITKAWLHPALLKLYSVQVDLHDLAVMTHSVLHGQPSSPPSTNRIPKLSILIPDPVLACAFPELIQQFKGDNIDANSPPDPVCASQMCSFTSFHPNRSFLLFMTLNHPKERLTLTWQKIVIMTQRH